MENLLIEPAEDAPLKGRRKLESNEEMLAFFLNLHNFVILFSLCKNFPKKFPIRMKEWIAYAKHTNFNVGGMHFTAFDIQHAIMRAWMGPPSYFSIIGYKKDYPVYENTDKRSLLKFPKAEPIMNFGFYFPYKSNPHLKIYTPENVTYELREIAGICLSGTKIANKKQLKLPSIMRAYDEDFRTGKNIEEYLKFIIELLPENIIRRYAGKILRW